MKKQLLPLLIILVLFTLVSNLFFGKKNLDPAIKTQEIALATSQTTYNVGAKIDLTIYNNLTSPISFPTNCIGAPFKVLKFENNQWIDKTVPVNLSNNSCEKNILTIDPSDQKNISFQEWTYRVFGETGQYQIQATEKNSGKIINSNIFTINPRSFLGRIWDFLLYQPIYNSLIFFASVIPGHSLGLSIIIITLIIRVILYFPSQKALRSQKRIQDIQPKLKNLQEQHKGNQEKIAMETMKLWREHKVNPLSSCLPILIQMPILIGLFYAIQDGLNPDNVHLLYPPLKETDFNSINVVFLRLLDLSQKNLYVLPVIVGGLQFLQMKLSFAKQKDSALLNKTKNDQDKMPDLQMMNNMMIYMMPAMIAIFTASLPAGVGLYWGISTLFGIIQQLAINREKNSNEPKVTVIK